MYSDFAAWLDHVLEAELPEQSAAVGFNLYEESDNGWSIQFIATERFDEEDPDWMCEETFTSGEDLFSWEEETEWMTILQKSMALIREYLEKGTHAERLKSYAAVGVGFVDGDIELVYQRD